MALIDRREGKKLGVRKFEGSDPTKGFRDHDGYGSKPYDEVLGYLTQFAGKASRLGAVGLTVLLFTALALVMTIDRTLNAIWRVRRPRPFAQRVLIYWAVITLGPLLLAASLSITSYLVSASRGLTASMPGTVRVLLEAVQFLLLAGALSGLYRYVPNAPVRGRNRGLRPPRPWRKRPRRWRRPHRLVGLNPSMTTRPSGTSTRSTSRSVWWASRASSNA